MQRVIGLGQTHEFDYILLKIMPCLDRIVEILLKVDIKQKDHSI